MNKKDGVALYKEILERSKNGKTPESKLFYEELKHYHCSLQENDSFYELHNLKRYKGLYDNPLKSSISYGLETELVEKIITRDDFNVLKRRRVIAWFIVIFGLFFIGILWDFSGGRYGFELLVFTIFAIWGLWLIATILHFRNIKKELEKQEALPEEERIAIARERILYYIWMTTRYSLHNVNAPRIIYVDFENETCYVDDDYDEDSDDDYDENSDGDYDEGSDDDYDEDSDDDYGEDFDDNYGEDSDDDYDEDFDDDYGEDYTKNSDRW
jgi:hypothetical protein